MWPQLRGTSPAFLGAPPLHHPSIQQALIKSCFGQGLSGSGVYKSEKDSV